MARIRGVPASAWARILSARQQPTGKWAGRSAVRAPRDLASDQAARPGCWLQLELQSTYLPPLRLQDPVAGYYQLEPAADLPRPLSFQPALERVNPPRWVGLTISGTPDCESSLIIRSIASFGVP